MADGYYRLFYHFVWATRDREPLLVGDIEQFAYALMRQKCRENQCVLAAIGGTESHVHLLVSLPRTLCIADFVKSVKGASAHLLNVVHGSPTWGFKWQGGYGVHTVSPGHVSTVRCYIENQKQHHADGTLLPEPKKSAKADITPDWKSGSMKEQNVRFADAGSAHGSYSFVPEGHFALV